MFFFEQYLHPQRRLHARMLAHPIADILPAYTFYTSNLLRVTCGKWWCAYEYTAGTRTAEHAAKQKQH
jgi:hypothetical protein